MNPYMNQGYQPQQQQQQKARKHLGGNIYLKSNQSSDYGKAPFSGAAYAPDGTKHWINLKFGDDVPYEMRAAFWQMIAQFEANLPLKNGRPAEFFKLTVPVQKDQQQQPVPQTQVYGAPQSQYGAVPQQQGYQTHGYVMQAPAQPTGYVNPQSMQSVIQQQQPPVQWRTSSAAPVPATEPTEPTEPTETSVISTDDF